MGDMIKKIAEASGISGIPDPVIEVPEKKKQTGALDVAEVVSGTKPPEECYVDKPGQHDMYLIWCGAHARAYGKAMSTQSWNVAEQKLVKSQLIARVEDKAALQTAFAHAVENWGAFTDYAKKQTEWFNPPERPSLAMLCKYPAVMVDFWRGHKVVNEIAGSGTPESMNKL